MFQWGFFEEVEDFRGGRGLQGELILDMRVDVR